MRVQVLHGPNLDLLGDRDPDLYGSMTLAEIDRNLVELGAELGLDVATFQSNHEGALIEQIHAVRDSAQAIVINPAGYGHTSVALRDALEVAGLPAIEVHLTNIYSREPFRRATITAEVCQGVIAGLGWMGYSLALRAIASWPPTDSKAP